MTTRIHIVNFGPKRVEVDTKPNGMTHTVYAQESLNLYVYDGAEFTIRESSDIPSAGPLTDK